MANAITKFKTYIALLDEVYKQASLTADLDSDPTLRASKEIKLRLYNELMSNVNYINVTTSWQYFTYTDTVDTSKSQYSNVVCSTKSWAGEWIEVHSLKFEKGNKPTDWTPAPEDVDNDITALEDRVTSAETSITQNTTAAFVIGKKVHRPQPDSKFNVRVRYNRTARNRNLLAAAFALIQMT